ncbi:hypothetical protein IWW38_003158, partial [Coemansia aciculifera]
MYTDPKLMSANEYLKKLPWFAPLVRYGLKFMEIVRSLTSSLTMYMTVSLYLRSLDNSSTAMTNSQ